MFDYAIKILRKEMARLLDRVPMMYISTEMHKQSEQVDKLIEAIKILEKSENKNER